MILNLITLIFLVLSIIFVVAVLVNQNKKEHFSLLPDEVFRTEIENIGKEIKQLKNSRYQSSNKQSQLKMLDQIEKDVARFDSLFENLRNSLNNNNIPICREIDLKQETVLGDGKPDICKDRSISTCALNSFCIVDTNENGEEVCRIKDLNPQCKDCVEVVDIFDDKNNVIGKKRVVKKMYLSPKIYDELKTLKIDDSR